MTYHLRLSSAHGNLYEPFVPQTRTNYVQQYQGETITNQGFMDLDKDLLDLEGDLYLLGRKDTCPVSGETYLLRPIGNNMFEQVARWRDRDILKSENIDFIFKTINDYFSDLAKPNPSLVMSDKLSTYLESEDTDLRDMKKLRDDRVDQLLKWKSENTNIVVRYCIYMLGL